MSHIVARHLHWSTAQLQWVHETVASQWICRASARDAGKANSYQLPGFAWLEFEARPEVDGKTLLLQTAFYEPIRGCLDFYIGTRCIQCTAWSLAGLFAKWHN